MLMCGHQLSLNWRKQFFPVMEHWHGYKMMLLTLHRRFEWTIKPVFKVMHPNSNHYVHPKHLGQVTHVTSVLRIASMQIIHKLKNALNDVEAFDERCTECNATLDPDGIVNLRTFLHFLLLHTSTTHDCGVSLKLDHFDRTWKGMKRFVVLFANFRHSEHLRSSHVNYLQLNQHKKNNTNAWKLISSKSSLADGEGGETLNSVFARKLAKDPMKTDVKHAERDYTSTNHIWSTCRAIETDTGAAHLAKERKDVLDTDSERVELAVQKLSDMLDELSHKHATSVRAEGKCVKCEHRDNFNWKTLHHDGSFRSDRMVDSLKEMEKKLRTQLTKSHDWFTKECVNVFPDWKEHVQQEEEDESTEDDHFQEDDWNHAEVRQMHTIAHDEF